MENSAGAIFDNRGILVGNEAKNGVTESYENNYHYGWKPIELDKIKLEGGVTASDIGLPSEIHTTEIPDVKWIAEQMVYYKNSLAIAKQNPDAWFENSLYLRNEVIKFLMYDVNPSLQYTTTEYLSGTERGHQKRDKEDKYLNPLYQKERLLTLRQAYPQFDHLGDNDDFLLACVESKYRKNDSKIEPIELSMNAKRSWLMPHGLLTVDDWHTEIFKKGYLQTAVYKSNRINPYDKTLDQDEGAWQLLQDAMGDNEADGVNGEMIVEFPPNLRNGYFVELPYLDNQNIVRKVQVITFDDIDHIPPKIFRDNNDPENIPQRIIILAKDTSGKLIAVKPNLENNLVIKEKMRFPPPRLTLNDLLETNTQINPLIGQDER